MRCVIILILGFVFIGCQSMVKKQSGHKDSPDDIITAVGKMTEGLTNQAISKKDLERLNLQMQKDPQARSAVESVNNAMQAYQTNIRYCPKDGKRFSNQVIVCPLCGSTLKDLDE